MDRRGSPGNDMNAARSLDRTMAGLDTLNSREPSCVLADMQKQLLQLEQQNKRVLLEQQNKRVLLKARVEEDEASKTSSAEIPALPIDRPHASQEHRLGLLMRDPQNKRRLELARAQTMGAFGQSSNEIPARYDNNNIHAGAQKRKRSTNGEGILPRPHNTSSDTASGWPNSHNVVNLIQDRVQAVPPFDLSYQIEVASKVVEQTVSSKTARSSADVPEDVRKLYKQVQGLARLPRGVIPTGIDDQIKLDADIDLDDLDVFVAKSTSGISGEELLDEYKALRGIRDSTTSCKAQQLHVTSWNERVHSRMLEQAIRGYPGVQYHNITHARVLKELVGGKKHGEALKEKTIDYAITLEPPLVPKSDVMACLVASPQPFHRTINPSEYAPLCHNPIAISIEIRSPNSSREHGEAQLSIWVTAHFNRLRMLTRKPVDITLPFIRIFNEHWQLSFARDLDGEIQIIDAVDFGSTADIIGCYTILKVLRLIVDWAKETFLMWFREKVLERRE